MVMQTPFLFPGHRCGQHRLRARVSAARRPLRNRSRRLLGRVGLPGYGERDVSHLSGGEAQRVSLARTLANSPEVLLGG